MTGQLDVAGPSGGRAPAVGVCGFGRCGSTMVMRLLDVGGVRPVVGADPPSYEFDGVEPMTRLSPDQLEGRAIKLLDTFMHFPTLIAGVRWKFIWLDRDRREQARSQAKFIAAIAGVKIPPSGVRDLERSYGVDRPRALGRLASVGAVLTLTYEDVLSAPDVQAGRIVDFLGADCAFDPSRAREVVHRRSPRCAPDMSFELGGGA